MSYRGTGALCYSRFSVRKCSRWKLFLAIRRRMYAGKKRDLVTAGVLSINVRTVPCRTRMFKGKSTTLLLQVFLPNCSRRKFILYRGNNAIVLGRFSFRKRSRRKLFLAMSYKDVQGNKARLCYGVVDLDSSPSPRYTPRTAWLLAF